MKHLFLIFIAVFAIGFEDVYSAMTEAQIKSTAKLMRNVCQPKTKATNEQIDGMHNGVWDGDRNAMCYMHCVLKMMKVANEEGDFLRDVILAQLPNLPEARRVPAETSLKNCDKGIKGADACETAYLNSKCFYEDNPQNYFLP